MVTRQWILLDGTVITWFSAEGQEQPAGLPSEEPTSIDVTEELPQEVVFNAPLTEQEGG